MLILPKHLGERQTEALNYVTIIWSGIPSFCLLDMSQVT